MDAKHPSQIARNAVRNIIDPWCLTMDNKAKDQDQEYLRKKVSKPIKINDGLDHEITEEQKRVNLKALRRLREQGV